jgi:hypothetical protein
VICGTSQDSHPSVTSCWRSREILLTFVFNPENSAAVILIAI